MTLLDIYYVFGNITLKPDISAVIIIICMFHVDQPPRYPLTAAVYEINIFSIILGIDIGLMKLYIIAFELIFLLRTKFLYYNYLPARSLQSHGKIIFLI